MTPSDPVVFDNVMLNTGGHYDPTTGVYTVPVDGDYEFILHFYTYNDFSGHAYLEVDNVRVNFDTHLLAFIFGNYLERFLQLLIQGY